MAKSNLSGRDMNDRADVQRNPMVVANPGFTATKGRQVVAASDKARIKAGRPMPAIPPAKTKRVNRRND